MSVTLGVTWHLELVDEASSKLLRQDRAIRTSLQQTEKAQAKLSKTATDSGQARVRGSTQTASALSREARAAAGTQRDVAQLNRAQAQALSIGGRLASSAKSVANAYRAQATAARQATAAERAREAAARGASRLAGGAQQAGAGLTRGTQTALAAAAGGGIAAKTIATFAGFEQQMDRVLAVSGATRAQFSALTDQAKQLGSDTSFSAREAADGMYQLSTAGFKANEVMRIIPGTLSLAAASGTDLASAAELQASALRGFGLQASQANRVADVLTTTVNRSAVEMFDLADSLKYIGPVARATGQSMESMLAALGLMGNVGVKGTQAGTTLRTALVRLTAPTDKSARALQTLGIQANELRGPRGLLPLPQILAKIVTGAQGVDKGTRNAAVAAIFGREALSGMIAMIDAGPGALNRNIDALKRSEGQAKRTAQVMRDNVAGGWDQFTGSLETAAITLTERFGPALKTALQGAAAGVSGVAGFLADVGAGAAGPGSSGATRASRQRSSGNVALRRDAQARVQARQHAGDDPSTARRIGATLANVAGTVGRAAQTAGAQLLDAFRPALPFFANVLLPLIEGVGKGLLISVVGAFKILVPIIRAVSGVLGFLGNAAKPLAPILRGVGTVIGVLFGGPILLKAVSVLGKFGFVGRAVGAGLKLLALPLRLVGGLFGKLGSLVGSAAGKVAGGAGRLANVVIVNLAALPGRAAHLAANVGARLVGGLRASIGAVRSVGSRIANALISFVVSLPGRVGALATRLASSFVGLGRKLVTAIVDGIKAAPGVILDALKSLIPAPLRKAASAVGGAVSSIFGGRGGGVVRRQAGGLIPAAVSPGELVTYGDAAWTVPGARTAADSVSALLPAGAAVWTDHGQQLLAAGMDPASALGAQLPHFREGGQVLSPGQMATLAYKHGRGKGMTTRGAIRMGAYGMRESKGRVDAHNYDPPRDDSHGLWQINVLPNANPRFRTWKLTNPDRNAEAMSILYKAGGEKPWGGYPESSITPYLQQAARGFGTSTAGLTSGTGSDSTLKVPLYLGRSRTRAGLLQDALSQGRAAGAEGLTRYEISQAGRGIAGARANPLIAAIRGAQTATTRELNLQARGRGGSSTTKLPAGVSIPNVTWNPARKPIARWIQPYLAYGASHDWTGTVTSGFRTRAEQARIYNSGVRPAARPGTGNHEGSSYPRGAVDVSQAAQLAAILGRRPGPHLLQWAGAKDPVHFSHPHGGSYRVGGLVNRSRLGANTPQALPGVSALRRGSALTALDDIIGAAVELRLRTLRGDLVRAVRRGGSKQTIQRLQGAIDLIDGELGRRIGILEQAVVERTAGVERGRGQFARDQRRLGIDPESARGLQAAALNASRLELPAAQQNVRDLRAALNRARRARAGKAVIAEIQTNLNSALDDLDELLVTQIERAAQIIRQQAQEHADQASFGLEYAQGSLSSLDIAQRGGGTADTPGGMLERAGAIRGTTIPALQGLIGAQFEQYFAAVGAGDAAGIRSAVLAIQSSGNDLASAIADAAQLTRDAAIRGAQDTVDAAAHGTSLASTGLQRLELEQKLAGTFDTGAAARAQYVQATILPALRAELDALREQERVARESGTLADVRAAIEAEAAKSNEILQAQLDVQEGIETNTGDRKFGGTLGFGYGGETLTDSLIAAGNGA